MDHGEKNKTRRDGGEQAKNLTQRRKGAMVVLGTIDFLLGIVIDVMETRRQTICRLSLFELLGFSQDGSG
ncbi:MAG: hypothetical protein JW818_08660 [Pirellulales bacterium]|nr:hypothetical protein [Pirellulales bacterium]